MRIYTTKSLKFDHPAGKGTAEPVVTRARSFATVPDWVEDSNMFKLASREQDTLTVVRNKTDELEAENIQTTADGNSTLKDLRDRARELGVKGFSRMGQDELLTAIDAAEQALSQQNPPDGSQTDGNGSGA